MADTHFTQSVPEGAEREDLKERSCEIVPGGTADGGALYRDREGFGGKVGRLMDPKLGPGNYSDWGHQGYMVQMLNPGFSYPSSNALMRRDPYQLNEKDNYDPAQPTPPRVKKHDDAGD